MEHALEDHEDRGQRRSELVRKSHLAQTEGLVPLLLQNDFLAQLQRLDVICNVVEINRGARLLQELDALHTGLVKLLEVFGPVLELENAVLLVGLVLLGQDDLLETHGLADLHLRLGLHLDRRKLFHVKHSLPARVLFDSWLLLFFWRSIVAVIVLEDQWLAQVVGEKLVGWPVAEDDEPVRCVFLGARVRLLGSTFPLIDDKQALMHAV